MTWLLKLYPPRWRRRYGAELTEMIAAQPFSIGAAIPLVPWFFGGGSAAKLASMGVALLTAAIVGIIISRYTERHRGATIFRQIAFTAIPAVITYVIGSALGVSA